jgi:hypothetical protein
MDMTTDETLAQVLEELQEIRKKVDALARQEPGREWYTIAEVAEILGLARYTVRENCRLGRIRAKKKRCGRGKGGGEWLVSLAELTRLKNEGYLPFQPSPPLPE